MLARWEFALCAIQSSGTIFNCIDSLAFRILHTRILHTFVHVYLLLPGGSALRCRTPSKIGRFRLIQVFPSPGTERAEPISHAPSLLHLEIVNPVDRRREVLVHA